MRAPPPPPEPVLATAVCPAPEMLPFPPTMTDEPLTDAEPPRPTVQLEPAPPPPPSAIAVPVTWMARPIPPSVGDVVAEAPLPLIPPPPPPTQTGPFTVISSSYPEPPGNPCPLGPGVEEPPAMFCAALLTLLCPWPPPPQPPSFGPSPRPSV